MCYLLPFEPRMTQCRWVLSWQVSCLQNLLAQNVNVHESGTTNVCFSPSLSLTWHKREAPAHFPQRLRRYLCKHTFNLLIHNLVLTFQQQSSTCMYSSWEQPRITAFNLMVRVTSNSRANTRRSHDCIPNLNCIDWLAARNQPLNKSTIAGKSLLQCPFV